MYAEPVEWVSSTGEDLIRNVVFITKIYIRPIWGQLLQRNLLNFKDPPVLLKTVFIKTTYFEYVLVNYFFENQGEQTCQTIKHFKKEYLAKIFGNNKTTFIIGKFLQKQIWKFCIKNVREKSKWKACVDSKWK